MGLQFELVLAHYNERRNLSPDTACFGRNSILALFFVFICAENDVAELASMQFGPALLISAIS